MSDERNEAEPIELGYIEDLGDMISVQEGSTVSRTVMQKAGGNVVLFSFDTGEEPSVMMLTMVTPARDNIGD